MQKNKNPIIAILSLLCLSTFVAGCAGLGGGRVMDRPSKEQITMGIQEPEKHFEPILEPNYQTLNYNNITIEVKHTPKRMLDDFFSDEKIFGKFASDSPYPDELIVFYVKISNMSGKTIKLTTRRFVLIDDFFSQYEYLTPDYISALYEKKGAAFGLAKTTAQAAPGIYGGGIGALSAITSSFSWKRYYLIQRVALVGGYIHDKVIYDGYVCFLKPHKAARYVTLVLPNIQYDLDANEEARDSFEFRFNFAIN